jgi:16S rRNA (uracil1498-N3)-methyltransferase
MRRRFFVNRFENSKATLVGETAGHLARVLRAEPGQLYELSDGNTVWLARIEEVGLLNRGENRIEFSLVEQVAAAESALRLTLLLALVKFDRFEWCLEKATELGVDEIVVLAADRTDKVLLAAAPKRYVRWEKILHESAQQSRRLAAPRLSEAIRPAKAFAAQSDGVRILLSERQNVSLLRDVLERSPGSVASATLAIGPEGGWTDVEIESARAAGFAEASLGNLILRTETAVISTLAIVRFALESR